MATETPEAPVQTDDAIAAKPSGSGFWLKFIAIAGLLIVVMIVQFLMLYFMFGE